MSLFRKSAASILLVLASAAGVWPSSSQPWKNAEPSQWSAADVEQILNNSPWSQQAGAQFALAPADERLGDAPLPGASTAGLAGPRGATDGRWDGGVGRNDHYGTPTLNVSVRWDSALPIRQALEQSHSPLTLSQEQAGKDYVLSVYGLVPAKSYRAVGTPETTSSSDKTVDPKNPEEMLEGLMRYSCLVAGGKRAITPDDVKIDPDTGMLRLFFPRTDQITIHDKDVEFQTRFGSLTVVKRFRLKDMLYKRNLEL